MNKIVAKLSLKEKIGYSLGDTASHFVWDMVGFWILIFYTDTFGISAAAAGTIVITSYSIHYTKLYETKNEDGSPKLNYQGNWRDIFQNWEALSLSFPEFIEGMICKFVNASTADGYNPYRITREGIDWECPEPNDPWAYIGYWGDHQIIYLQKFLELSEKYHPAKLDELLHRDIFAYANVPYRIKPYRQMVQNPQDTILFDHVLNAEINRRVKKIGADARLLPDLVITSYSIHYTKLYEVMFVMVRMLFQIFTA